MARGSAAPIEPDRTYLVAILDFLLERATVTGLPAVLGRETLTDFGGYVQVLYGFRRNWVAGLRFDYVTGNRGDYENQGLIVSDGAGGGTGGPGSSNDCRSGCRSGRRERCGSPMPPSP